MKYHLNAMKRQKKWISVARVKIIALSFYSHILILLKLGRPSVGRRQERERERERKRENYNGLRALIEKPAALIVII